METTLRLRPCCVPTCDDKTSPRFTIPTDTSVRGIWVQRIKNKALEDSDDPGFIHNHRVCKNHFALICFDDSGHLKKFSLPALNLPGYNEPPTEENSFSRPKPDKSTHVTPDKLKGVPVEAQADPGLEPEPLSDLSVSVLSKTPSPPERAFEVIPKRGEKRAASPVGVDRPKKLHKREKLLQIGGATQQSQLTLKAKAFYKRTCELQKVAEKLNQAQVPVRKILKFLISNEKLWEYLRNVNPTTAKFFACQQHTQKHKQRDRRFNFDEKILALSLYKQSGRAYRFLSNIFSLPSRQTLTSLLNKIPLRPCVNESIFQHLQNTVRQLKPLDRYCVLMFDEISLKPGLQYNQRADVLEGFVDYGGSAREVAFADRALVFIAKGIRKQWQQPVCFTFSEGTTPTAQLVKIVKDVVRAVRGAGLHIVATISDQGATSQAAINELLRETSAHFLRSGEENRFQGYLLDGEEIIHLYDFPHLMKGIRDNLLTKDLVYTESGVTKVASWGHVLRSYQMDKSKGVLCQFFKLSDEHVLPEKINKTKVENCTQVFSHTVGSVMYTSARMSESLPTESRFYLDPKAVETARILLFFDNLFDSVNGAALHPPVGKQLRCVASKKTDHVKFWKTCISMLESMSFVKPTDHSKKMYAPSLENWIFSLKGMICIVQKLFEKRFRHVNTKCFNQDSIKQFFTMVKSHGSRNTNPTCASFISSTKVLLLNNFVSHSAGANCDEDESVGVLDTLKKFITEQANAGIEPPSVPLPVLPPSKPVKCRFIFDSASAYVAGYAAKKILATVNCPACSNKMCADKDIPQNVLIVRRKYEDCRLTRPSSTFSCVFRKVTEVILNFLPTIIVPIYIIKGKVKDHVRNLCFEDISSLFCDSHHVVNNVEIFLTITIDEIFFDYVKTINKIVHGTDLRKAGQDAVTSVALKKHLKRSKPKRLQ